MSLIKKIVPSDEIIKILSKEIQEFGLDFAKDKGKGKLSMQAFDNYKNTIPKTAEIHKASGLWGAYGMDRTKEPFIKEVCDLLGAYECTNTMYYAPNSCIDWHTNSDNEGKRVYILFTNKPGIFRYRDPNTGEIIDDYDNVGWTQREFKVTKSAPLWHCVYSPGPRFAYGFNVNDNI